MHLILKFYSLSNIPPKMGLLLLTEAVSWCVKEWSVEIRMVRNSALHYATVRLPGHNPFWMEQNLWSTSVQFSWSLFKTSSFQGLLLN